MLRDIPKKVQSLSRPRLLVAAAVLMAACAGAYGYTRFGTAKQKPSEVSSQSRQCGMRTHVGSRLARHRLRSSGRSVILSTRVYSYV